MQRALAGALVVAAVAAALAAPATARADVDAPRQPLEKTAPVPPVPAAPPVLPLTSPFGPPWDPTRPPPEEPQESGPGILAATLVAHGPADVEELRDERKDAPPLYAVVLDLRLAASSTTPRLGPSSVTLELEHGATSPLVAACTPTMDDPIGLYYRGEGASMGAWHVAVEGRAWFCGGGTQRMAIRVGRGGLRLVTGAGPDKSSGWQGPLVLLFEPRAEAPRHVVLPGARIELPARNDDADRR